MTTTLIDVRVELTALNEQFRRWLVEGAYPHWAAHGIDPRSGAFIEALAQDGAGLALPRRARVQPRQVYAFAQGLRLGWRGAVTDIVRRGIDRFVNVYRRDDGLFSTLASVDGSVLDTRALLYDQAFALLGFAAAATVLGELKSFENHALRLRDAIKRVLRTADGSFRSESDVQEIRESNPHMHLLEACLSWTQVGKDGGWQRWADELAELAIHRFIHKDTHALGEAFTPDWRPAAGVAGRIVEPGHQFEWAWLLLRLDRSHLAAARETALDLITIGELHGVRNGVAINALVDDFKVHDANARLWPQTERLKAALLAAQITGDARYWRMACAAAESIRPYLTTPIRGLWYDAQLSDGTLVDSPVPASTFYHLVGAIAALDQALIGRQQGTQSAD